MRDENKTPAGGPGRGDNPQTQTIDVSSVAPAEAAFNDLLCHAVPLADEIHDENVLVLDAVVTLLCRNTRFRDVVLALISLAALPSRRLDDLHRAAREAWFNAQADKRALELMHGNLPPCPCDDYPAPSWAGGAA